MNRILDGRSRLAPAGAVLLLPFVLVGSQGVGDPIFHQYRMVEPTIREAGKEVEAHHFDRARRLLDPVVAKIPDHAGAQFLLASMAYQERDFEGALKHIEISERSLEDLHQRYAAVLATLKSNEEVDARVTQDSLNNLVGAGYDSIDDILADKRQHLKEIEENQGSLRDRKVDLGIPAVYSLLHGNCLFRLGRFQEAAVQYQAAIRSEPTSVKAWNNLVNLWWVAKDLDQARAALAKAEAAGVAIQPQLKQQVLEAK